MSVRPTSILLFLAAAAPAIYGQPKIEFNRDIRPILAENCFACHGPDPGARKADMRLDTEAGFFAEREDAPPVVIKGNPEESELYQRLITGDADDIMPPPKSHKKLSPEQIALVRTWISENAPWQAHWSLRSPVRPGVPTPKKADWSRNAVDR
ncbi:MAG: c-type cytochrome domain-containing protein, partial [Verrucomicrobiota bacterium]|nr:c-type cytochrome domain-containing protein [Verrucomicrobiota bacterium]